VLSSGAERPMELRGPHDVANLGMSLLGMPHDCAHRAVGANLAAVLEHARLRKAGGLRVEPVADDDPSAVRREQIPGMIQVARQNSSAEAAGSRKRKLGSVATKLIKGGRDGRGGGRDDGGDDEDEEDEEVEKDEKPRSADFMSF